MRERVLIIGARQRRQGIGHYVAREFHASGCEVCAVVGTTDDTAGKARDALRTFGIDATAYSDLRAALDRQRPEIVAICSPYAVHREHLRLTAGARAHCLCEKPLCWRPPADLRSEAEGLVDAFVAAGRYLDLLTQWPRTLPTYFQLIPRVQGRPIERFQMRLSPIAHGPDMVLDAAPHMVSMLWALAGAGEIAAPRAQFGADGRELTLDFDYRHASGNIAVACHFGTCEQQPRPAWYAINGHIAERRIEMPGYRMHLRRHDGAGELPLPDPLALHVRSFVDDVRHQAATDRQRLVQSVTHLATLYEAVLAAT